MPRNEVDNIIAFIDSAINDLKEEMHKQDTEAYTDKQTTNLSYAMFLDDLASREYEAMLTKLDEHGIKGCNPKELMLCSADWSSTSLKDVYWAYAGRHLGALYRREHLDQDTLKKRLLDAYGYITLALYILDTGDEL